MVGLDLLRDPLNRLAQSDPIAVAVLAVQQPVAQLPLLPARQGHHLAGILSLALDEREGLQHRVVQVRGRLRAFLDANALGALKREAPGQTEQIGRDQQADGDHGHERLYQPPSAPDEHVGLAQDNQRRSHDKERAQSARGPTAPRGQRARRPGCAAHVLRRERLAEDQGHAARGQQQREHDHLAQPQTERAQQEQRGSRDAGDSDCLASLREAQAP
jgi:hypothetical protein